MIEYERTNLNGVPDYTAVEFEGRRHDYCLLIPVINEGARILTELGRAQKAGIDQLCDIVICDGGSTDGSMKRETLALYHVNTLLTKTGPGRQGAQLRMGMYFALDRNYKGVLTIDGNNKDSIEDVPEFIAKLQEGYDLVKALKENVKVPIVVHTHCTTGLGPLTLQKAVEAGADVIDTAISCFSGGTAQPATETLAYALRQEGYEVSLDDKKLKEINDFFKLFLFFVCACNIFKCGFALFVICIFLFIINTCCFRNNMLKSVD